MGKFTLQKESINETIRFANGGEERTTNQVSYRVLDEDGNNVGNVTCYCGSENIDVNFRFSNSGKETTNFSINVEYDGEK